MNLIIYTEPIDSHCVLSPDSAQPIQAIPGYDSNARPCQIFDLPEDLNDGWGAWLEISSPGKITLKLKGILFTDSSPTYPNTASLAVDDFPLSDIPTPEPIPDPLDPFQIIQNIFDSGEFDLSTKHGCGQFTEECCEQLHILNSRTWGHIKKEPAQNQFNSHAVDAVQCLVDVEGAMAGIYDIIQDSESLDAKPAFNYKEPPNPSLWMYPAPPIQFADIRQVKSK